MDDREDGSFITALHKPAALLPIARHRKNLLYLIDNTAVTIVVAATGSGKTTQIPQYLEQAGWCSGGKMIGVTQVGKSQSLSMFKMCSKLHSHGGLPRRVLLQEWQMR